MDHNELGKLGEDLAVEFLESIGMMVLDRNYRFEKSELDIVALEEDQSELVVVEVKARSSIQWVKPEDAVTPEKQKLIFKAAQSYIYERQMANFPVRFDVVAISMENPDSPDIVHFPDAFRQDIFY